MTTLSGCHFNHLYSLLILSSPSGINWINQVVLFSSFTKSIHYLVQSEDGFVLLTSRIFPDKNVDIDGQVSYHLDSILVVLPPRFRSCCLTTSIPFLL